MTTPTIAQLKREWEAVKESVAAKQEKQSAEVSDIDVVRWLSLQFTRVAMGCPPGGKLYDPKFLSRLRGWHFEMRGTPDIEGYYRWREFNHPKPQLIDHPSRALSVRDQVEIGKWGY